MYESRKEHSLRKIYTFLLLLALQKAMNFTILIDIIMDSITMQLVFFHTCGTREVKNISEKNIFCIFDPAYETLGLVKPCTPQFIFFLYWR